MKAIIFEKFGSADVLKEAEVPMPIVNSGEVLVKIRHTSVNPVDWKIREGFLKDILPHQFPIIPGWDVAGEIASLSPESKHQFNVGDQVYAYTRLPVVHSGTYAEYISIPESYLAHKPKNLSTAESAAIPLVALTAYQALVETAQLSATDRVLILGGSGGVGSFAIQFAKIWGANVVATTSASNLDYLKSLGASEAIDYTSSNWINKLKELAQDQAGYDVILDAVGGETLKQVESIAGSNTRIVSIVDTPKRGNYHFVYPNGEQLQKITNFFENKKLKLPEIKIKNIREAKEAQEESAKRHIRGKLVLEVNFQ